MSQAARSQCPPIPLTEGREEHLPCVIPMIRPAAGIRTTGSATTADVAHCRSVSQFLLPLSNVE